ncbi:MAG: hypothetical protein JO091_03735 [Acidobacteriaceae bacterium]|nr:hypothetical protein [Acidobacteriaceae bacterium]
MRRNLVAAGRRYAALAETNAGSVNDNVIRDRTEFSRFLRNAPAGTTMWDDVGAIEFVQFMTGYDAAICQHWLIDEWDMDVAEQQCYAVPPHSFKNCS